MAKPFILLVEDSPSMAEVYLAYLETEPDWRVMHAADGTAGLRALDEYLPDIMLLDLQLPDMDGLEILKSVHERQLPTTVIIITAHGNVDIAVEAMCLGAYDFIEKPFPAKRLLVTVTNALAKQALTQTLQSYQETYERKSFHGFIGASAAMRAVYQVIGNVAGSLATVFITGESGTGKEVCAEAIHAESNRADRPFVVINCGAIPKDLMESEIFGHVRGAFTGAVSDRQGAAAAADGGALFLDEIGELPLDLQSKLLRFLQNGQFQRVGGQRVETVDVRIICATNRDPWVEVRQGRFREDLYYRLNVIPMTLPPLRDRGEDILLLANHFLMRFAKEESKRFSRFTPEAEQRLLDHAWPGNVRELQNVVRQAVVLNPGPELGLPALGIPQAAGGSPPVAAALNAFGPTTAHPQAPEQAEDPESIEPLWLVEKRAIEHAIGLCGGNIPLAAARLEINPSTIYRKRQAWRREGS